MPQAPPSPEDIPPEVREAAATVKNWAEMNGFHEWKIGGVAERSYTSRLERLCAEQAAVLTASVVRAVGYDHGGKPPEIVDGQPFYPPAMVPLSAIMERLHDAPVFRDLPEQVQAICRKIRKERYGIE